jgi:hypothetical protein
MMDEDKIELLKQYFERAKRKGFTHSHLSPQTAFLYALENLESLDWNIELAIKYHNVSATDEEWAEISSRKAIYSQLNQNNGPN